MHRDFCAVAIRDGRGRARSVGRVQATPEQLELFAQSLGPNDRVALEATSNALAIARILEPHVAEVVFAQPEKRASPQGAQAGLAPWPGRHRLEA